VSQGGCGRRFFTTETRRHRDTEKIGICPPFENREGMGTQLCCCPQRWVSPPLEAPRTVLDIKVVAPESGEERSSRPCKFVGGVGVQGTEQCLLYTGSEQVGRSYNASLA
jgi:hypothetical protein